MPVPALALFLWPTISLALFAWLGRERALIWSVVAGYLFLPENVRYDLPGLPPYNKNFAISLGICLGAVFFWKKKSWANAPLAIEEARLLKVLLIVMVILISFGALMTVRSNAATLVYEGTRFTVVHPGMKTRDVISLLSDSFTVILPFFLAWRWLQNPTHYREVLLVLVIAGSVYSFLALFEMRFSPQLNRSFYGFFPHEWLQHVRGGRFRPLVFLQHGLWLAFFLFVALISAFGFARQSTGKTKVVALGAGLWLAAVLLISPNLGAAMLAFLFVPLVLLPRVVQLRVIWTVAFIVLIFPALRQAGLFQTEHILAFSEAISEERAASLAFRFRNEDDLLARAIQKPYFGWGGWGRWRIINEHGVDVTVADGLWIIVLSSRGWIGYIGFFGILIIPLLLLSRAALQKEVPYTITTMGLILSANLIYIIPNSALSPIGWLIGGSIASFISWKVNEDLSNASPLYKAAEPPQSSPYTRFSNGERQITTITLRR